MSFSLAHNRIERIGPTWPLLNYETVTQTCIEPNCTKIIILSSTQFHLRTIDFKLWKSKRDQILENGTVLNTPRTVVRIRGTWFGILKSKILNILIFNFRVICLPMSEQNYKNIVRSKHIVYRSYHFVTLSFDGALFKQTTVWILVQG